MRKGIATGIAAMFFATAAVPAHAMDPILPFQDVKGGMTGTAYTVVDSSGEIRSFDVDIVGNMDNGKGSSRMIMARARGPVIEQTGGILQGMSGSPVYVNGRLVGAVAAGIKEMTPYTFFITPIEDMMKLWTMPDTKNKTRLKTINIHKVVEERKKEEAKAKAEETGWTFKEDAGRGWRQVVASPKPVRIVEFDAVKDLMDAGYIVVSTGGGGVPVFEKEGLYEGVPAVIDKDRSSAKLAADFGADMLVILTAVEKVCVNFGKPDQAEIDTMTIAEAEEFIAQGQFAPGSMLPKVEACIEYVRAFPEGKALITSLECAAAGIEGKTGTVITA